MLNTRRYALWFFVEYAGKQRIGEQAMLIGLCAAAIFLPFCLFFWWMEVLNIVPWLYYGENVRGIFLCVASIYVPMFPGVFAYICHRNGAFSAKWNRLIGTFVLGASLGLFICTKDAIDGEKFELREFRTQRFELMLCGKAPNEVCERARELFPKAEVLSMLLRFLNNCMWDANQYAVTTILIVLLYDRVSAIKHLRETS
jgi:hypothetical protein